MFDFSTMNKTTKRTVREGINTDNMKFESWSKFVGKDLHVDGFFFTTSKYGEQVVIVAEGTCINIPKRFVDDFKAIRDNDEALACMMDGHMVLKNVRAIDSKNGKTGTFDFVTV